MGHKLGCLFVAAAMLLGVFVAVGSPPVPTPLSLAATTSPPIGWLGWQMVFEDQFAEGELDPGVWTPEVDNDEDGDDGDPVVHTADALAVSSSCPGDPASGCLTISTWTQGSKHYTGGVRSGGGNSTPPFDSGFEATYGYIEARINFMNQSGTNATFWMLPHSKGSPFGDPSAAGPEIDIAEHQNASDTANANTMNVAMHWDGSQEHHKSAGRRVNNPTSTPLQGRFHTYGLLWNPAGYTVFIDGNAVWRGTEAVSYAAQYLLLTADVMDVPGFTGPVPAGGYGSKSSTQNKTVVDYVRVWQRPSSDIPDQSVAAGSPLSVPFSVAKHHSTAPGGSIPESIVVTATTRSQDQALLPNARVSVAGNDPTDPDGSLIDSSFVCCWAPTGAASISQDDSHSGSTALRLGPAGGRAHQRISNLRPETTYVIDGWFNVTSEPGKLRVGVLDVDSSAPGEQAAMHEVERNDWSVWYDGGWTHDQVTFTTGPGTTEVTVAAENLDPVPSTWRVVSYVDDLTIRPLAIPKRTVSLLPLPGRTGRAVVTLTTAAISRNGQQRVLGTESFAVSVNAGSLTNGGFQAGTTGWFADPTAVVSENLDPATEDEHFHENDIVAVPTKGGAAQVVTGLRPQTSYTVRARGRVQDAAQVGTGLLVGEYDAGRDNEPVVGHEFRTTDWSEGSVTFTTGPQTDRATVMLADFTGPAGASYFDDVSIRPTNDILTAPVIAPLTTIGPQRIRSSSIGTVAFTHPTAVAGVRSSNPYLLPDHQIGLTAPGGHGSQVVTFMPVPDRTGVAIIDFLDAAGTPLYGIAVLVTDGRLDDAALSGQQIAAPTELTQVLPRLEFDATYVIGARVVGTAQLEIRDYDDTRTNEPPITRTITGNGWTFGYLPFTMPRDDYRCVSDTGSAKLIIRSTGTPVTVHDVVLFHGPALTPIPEWSVHEGAPTSDWTNENSFTVGRVPDMAPWDPAEVALSSSNPVVLPAEELVLQPSVPTWRARWTLAMGTPAGVTGRSEIGVHVTDPTTGATVDRSFPVTVNAGTTLDNSAFELGLYGWRSAIDARVTVEPKVTMACKPTYRHPDWDKVLRIDAGSVSHEVGGLAPATPYVLEGWGRGSGSVVQVLSGSLEILGSSNVGSAGGASLAPISFTTPPGPGPVSVWILVQDLDPASGTSWIDDIGVFAA